MRPPLRLIFLVLTFLVPMLVAQRPGAPALTSPLERLKGNRGGEIVLSSIQAQGGWAKWASKTDVQYERFLTRYEDDGRIIREKQFHRFVLPPRVLARFETLREGKRVVTGFDGAQAWVIEDGKRVDDSERLQGFRRSAFGTQYMFCLPFRLTDAGARYEYLGTAKLGGKAYDKAKVSYAPGTGDNPEQVWTFYFNQKTHFMERVDWTDGKSYSITEFKDYRKVDGLWLPHARSNYHSDAQGNKKRKFRPRLSQHPLQQQP